MSLGPDFSDGNVPQRSFGERLLGAIKLDATVYEEVEHTPDAVGQAAGVVVLRSHRSRQELPQATAEAGI